MIFKAVKCMSHDLPLKAQVRTVKNMGTDDIYILPIEFDIPYPSNLPLPPVCVRLPPGAYHDIANDSGFYYLTGNGLDKEVTIHSLSDIDIDIESDVFYDTYPTVANHPWNGGLLPNGDYTEKYQPKSTHIAQSSPYLISPSVPVFFGYRGPTVWELTSGMLPRDETPIAAQECICTSRTLFNAGCICGHIKRQKWGI
jgi:hypothetical protein